MSNTPNIKSIELLKEAALQSLKSSDQFSTEEREAIASAIAAAIERFGQGISNKIAGLTRKNLLQIIANLQQQFPSGQKVDDTQLAQRTVHDLPEIREHLAHMEEDGYVELARTAERWSVLLTPEGQELIGK